MKNANGKQKNAKLSGRRSWDNAKFSRQRLNDVWLLLQGSCDLLFEKYFGLQAVLIVLYCHVLTNMVQNRMEN